MASYTIGRYNRSLDYSGEYKIAVAVNGFSIPGSPFIAPACVGFQYHPRIFSREVRRCSLIGRIIFFRARLTGLTQGLTIVGSATCASILRLWHPVAQFSSVSLAL